MDFFQSAFQGKIISMYEYFLIGSVLDSAKDGLLEILRGLCDNPEKKPIEFTEQEYIYSFITNTSSIVNLRARCSRLPTPPISQQQQHNEKYWHLRYIGQSDLKEDKARGAMVRNYIDCLTSSNLNEFLPAMGFHLDAEFAVQGTLFHKGRLKIIVSKLYIQQAPNVEPQPINMSHLIEVTCIVPAGQDTIATEIKQFADLLKPYVKMEKLHSIIEELQALNPHVPLPQY